MSGASKIVSTPYATGAWIAAAAAGGATLLVSAIVLPFAMRKVRQVESEFRYSTSLCRQGANLRMLVPGSVATYVCAAKHVDHAQCPGWSFRIVSPFALSHQRPYRASSAFTNMPQGCVRTAL